MQAAGKADRFTSLMTEINMIDKKWLFGNETDDPLRFAFDAKRTVHPGVKGEMIPRERWKGIWEGLMNKECSKTKRAAYIHIPFCQTRCLYCGFFQNFSDSEMDDVYIQKLESELRMASDRPFVQSRPIHAVYIGGGTPSALSAENIIRLLGAINRYLPVANDCEFTFEARFCRFDNEKIQACIDNGINRFSLGVQSFNTRVRNSIGRLDSRETVLEKLNYLCSIDHASVIIDLMYGLPYQTMEIWENDVKSLIESRIDGGDLYQLNIYEDSKLKQAIEKGALPAAAKTSEQALMFKKAVEIMQRNRIRRLSMCHWADTTRERNIYNSLSKSGAVTLPFGAGAGGRVSGYTVFVERDIKKYIDMIDRGEKPLMFMMSQPQWHELYSDIIGQIDSRGHLNLSSIKERHGIDLEEICMGLFKEWVKRGLVEINDTYIDLTIAGQFWYVNLTQAILDWMELMQKEDYSITVKAVAGQR